MEGAIANANTEKNRVLQKLPGFVRKVVEDIKKNEKVVAIILFGSLAKGRVTPLSDIDLAVIIKEPDPKTEAEIGSMCSRMIDISLFHKLPVYIQHSILKDGIVLYLKKEDEDFYKEVVLKVIRNYLEMEWIYRKRLKEVFG
ncbi:nucleotidyltransferase domain-containing protein [Candidatus Woesearchaeota archaeon]|nr:MAG: nucleotidyltransferase domain-containing protein [Candidatus Woesearchaeota archaeon]